MTTGQNPLRRFADETWPDERELAHYNRRLSEITNRPARPVWSGLWMPATAGALAAGAALIFALNPTSSEISAPQTLAMQFQPTGEAVSSRPTEQVSLTTNGVATLSGTALAPVIDLTSGSVKVQVEPKAGIDLRVRTPDGEVQVLGTIFSVDRGPLGTAVQVERGRVAVRCAGGVEHPGLVAGESALCLPTTAEGMLGRAAGLAAAGAPDRAL